TGEAILTDIHPAPPIEPPVDHLDTRQVVTATFHHSSGEVIDLVVADSRPFLPGLPGRTFAAGEPQCRAVVPTAQPRNQGVNDWDNRSTEVAASREVLSGGEDQQEAASDSPLSAFGSPLSPAGEVGHSNHEPAESEETIGTTSNHPFWSVDRREFVQAGSLEIGERLQTLSGDVKVVQQKLPRPGPQPVFNLEVHYEHVYFVGEDGVLVHNSEHYVGNHGRLKASKDQGLAGGRNGDQLHHLNQDAVYGTKHLVDEGIEYSKGAIPNCVRTATAQRREELPKWT
ncbi:MAG: polymorphic toxin-type HINT domain-containing protein, partial [Planctomycetaceae bacterium]